MKEVSDYVNDPCLKFLIVCIPIFFLFSVFIYYFIHEPEDRENEDKETRDDSKDTWMNKFITRTKNAFTSLFLIYQNKLEEDTTYEKISEDEPSVRKFRIWMNNISNDLIKKKLIIVFDNMDRLPTEKVKELWSSIHVFFAETEYKNIRVIVPFDRLHIQDSFENKEIKSKANDRNNYGDDFINKTFHVVYRVSPPILSEWKNYFKIQWQIAFGEKTINTQGYQNVIQIFDLLNTEITPRKVIAFINEFVTIRQMLKSPIPDKYIALFIFGKNHISKDPINEILKPTYLKSLEFLYLNDEELPKYIAALFYQVDSMKSIQIIFKEKLKESLNNNDVNIIDNISLLPEFFDILYNSIAELTNIENVILALSSVSDDKIGTTSQNQVIWDCLFWKEDREDVGSKLQSFQKILLKKTSNRYEYSQKLIRRFKDSKDFNGKDYYESICEIQNLLGANSDLLSKLNMKETSVEDFIKFLKVAKYDYGKYKLYCNENELNKYLVSLEPDKYSTIDFIPYIIKDYKFDEFINKLKNKFTEIASTLDIPLISTFNRLLKEVSIDKPINSILSDEQIYNLYQKTNKNDEIFYDLIAMRIARLDKFEESYKAMFDEILQNIEVGFVEKIAERIEYYIDYEELLLGLKSFKSPLVKSIANKLTKKSYGVQTASIKTILANFEEICLNGDINPIDLINNLNEWKERDSITKENIKETASTYFLENAKIVDCDLTKHCFNCLKKYFDSLSVEQWQKIFEDDNSYEFIGCNLLEDYEIPHVALDAIKVVLKEIAIGSKTIPNSTLWVKLMEKLEKQNKDLKTLFKNVRDQIFSNVSISPEIFNFLANWLFQFGELEDKKESLRMIFPSNVLRNEQSLSILLNNKEKMYLIISKAEDEVKDFKDTIKDILKTNNDESFIGFANSIGLGKLDEAEKDEDIESDGKNE